jgi:hypothetical protein
MALSGWAAKCPITINHKKLNADVKNQPVLLVAANVPADVFASANSDGSDIRFCDDSLGTTEYPRDIVKYDSTNGILAIYVLLPAISSSTDTVFWMFWGNAAASEPGVGTSSQNTLVWDKWYGVLHFKDVTAGWKGVKDTSGRWNALTIIGTLPKTWPDGHAEGLTAFPESSTLGMKMNELVSFAGSTLDFMFWVNFNGTYTTGDIANGTNNIPLGWSSGGAFGQGWGGFTIPSGKIAATGWHHMVISDVAGVVTGYVDGVSVMTGGATAAGNNFGNLGLGTTTSPAFYMSEFRMTRGNTLTAGQIYCMYSNESAPASFCAHGTVQSNPVTYTLTLTGLKANTEVRIYEAGTTTELTGIESTETDDSEFSYTYVYSANYKVDIVIHNLNYQYIRYSNFTLGANDNKIPIQQIVDRDYYNP